MFLRALVNSLAYIGGVELPTLYIKQLVAQLIIILWYGQQDMDTIGILIRANAEALHLETGLQGKIFEMPLFSTYFLNCGLSN